MCNNWEANGRPFEQNSSARGSKRGKEREKKAGKDREKG
jgi:hypothetical protein